MAPTLWEPKFEILEALVRKRLVIGLNYDCSKDMKICESCVKGKLHRNPFTSSERYTRKPLELVHTDVCGKLEASSLSGGQYFLTFIDDYSCYIWIYILKHKSEVFTCFKEWKAMVEKSTGHGLISIRSDNGGEYLSSEFQSYLKVEGIKHERTVPKNPEQNGIAERLNRPSLSLFVLCWLMQHYPRSFGPKPYQPLPIYETKVQPRL